jgi:phage shock protein PspC (stress-responsive transcriptional regulator)
MSEYSNGNSKRLYRSRKGQMVGGVCAGVAEHFGVDVNLVRLGFAVFTIFAGVGVLVYLAAWVMLPEEGEDTSIAETWMSQRRS